MVAHAVDVPVPDEDRTWSLTPVNVSVSSEDAHGRSCPLVFVFPMRITWSLTPIHVTNEDRTWSLTSVNVPVSSEDLTWLLTYVHVPISGEDSLSHQSTLALYFRHPCTMTLSKR